LIQECNSRVIGHLGSGQFGNVEKGMWQSTEVALKNLKEGSGGQDKVKFLQEAAIMAQFIHPNIVTLHGVVSDKEPVSSNVAIYTSV
jgi:serine/threonine protein kinase